MSTRPSFKPLRRAVSAALATAFAAAALAGWQPAHADEFPRFLSLKSDLVNLRVGPGRRYPIDWVYKRRGLPLLVIARFEQWRRVRDHEGTRGWVHQSLLSQRRTALTVGGTQTMRTSPSGDAPAILRAEAGVLADLLDCEGDWCRVSLADETGWAPRDGLWGAGPPPTPAR